MPIACKKAAGSLYVTNLIESSVSVRMRKCPECTCRAYLSQLLLAKYRYLAYALCFAYMPVNTTSKYRCSKAYIWCT